LEPAFGPAIFLPQYIQQSKSAKPDNPFKGRSGSEIYEALFGARQQNCVQVINKKDQVVPRLDCCIWLEFKSCPTELRRIIAQGEYRKSVMAAKDSTSYIPNYSPRPEWFRPAVLGDSIVIWQQYNPEDPNRDQILICFKRQYTCLLL
jgi:hypothetical protein